MKNQLDGQIDLKDFSKMYRTKCLITGEDCCNIFNLHDVAVSIGVECSYGCCCSCEYNRQCGACCNTASSIAYRKMREVK